VCVCLCVCRVEIYKATTSQGDEYRQCAPLSLLAERKIARHVAKSVLFLQICRLFSNMVTFLALPQEVHERIALFMQAPPRWHLLVKWVHKHSLSLAPLLTRRLWGTDEEKLAYQISSLLFQGLHQCIQTRSRRGKYVFVSSCKQFTALFYESLLVEWVCVLMLGPKREIVLLFSPTTWLAPVEVQRLVRFVSARRPVFPPLHLKLYAAEHHGTQLELPPFTDVSRLAGQRGMIVEQSYVETFHLELKATAVKTRFLDKQTCM
jgi:hypothetical protein